MLLWSVLNVTPCISVPASRTTQPLTKMAVFWVVPPCNLVEIYQCFKGFSLIWLTNRPDDGGSNDFRNVGKLLPNYTKQQPRSQSSSYSPQWTQNQWHLQNCRLHDCRLQFGKYISLCLATKGSKYFRQKLWHVMTHLFNQWSFCRVKNSCTDIFLFSYTFLRNSTMWSCIHSPHNPQACTGSLQLPF
jgi:hypothetical protein